MSSQEDNIIFQKTSFLSGTNSSYIDHTGAWKSAIVIDNVGILPHSHAAGGKRYSILPYGEVKPIEVEERQMKFHR